MATDDVHGLCTRAARARRIVAPLVLVALAQCSELGPFEGPAPTADAHSLCYNRTSTDQKQLRTVAVAACAGSEPQFLAQNLDFSACPLLMPERLSFSCGT